MIFMKCHFSNIHEDSVIMMKLKLNEVSKDLNSKKCTYYRRL